MKWFYYVMIVLVLICIVGIVTSVIMNKKSKKVQRELKIIEDNKRNNTESVK